MVLINFEPNDRQDNMMPYPQSPHRPANRLAAFALMSLLSLTAACVSQPSSQDTNPTPDNTASKDAQPQTPLQGDKADDTSDVCLDNGWYGDGECDVFCPEPDLEDCQDDPCRVLGKYNNGACDDWCPDEDLICYRDIQMPSCSTNTDCPSVDGQQTYCHFTTAQTCNDGFGQLDHNGDVEEGVQGQCRIKPATCVNYPKPVCGCDGRSHMNACQAAAAGTSVRHEGHCTSDLNPDCARNGCQEYGSQGACIEVCEASFLDPNECIWRKTCSENPQEETRRWRHLQ